MSPLLETAGVSALGIIGVVLGRWFSRLPKPYWLLGYLFPLTMIVLIGLAYRIRPLEFLPPFTWMMAGRRELALTALIGTMVLTTPLSRLPLRRDRIAVRILMVWVVVQVTVWPFLAPAFNQNKLAALQTRVDADGVCLQSNEYTCGPAAAVTALRLLGFPAEESEIALLARTTSAQGTQPDVLANTLRQRYGADGLTCEYRSFEDVDDLRLPGYTLALVKFAFMVDHYVAVLDVNDTSVVVGDPLSGRQVLPRAEFAKKWRRVGVVLNQGETVTPDSHGGNGFIAHPTAESQNAR